uniref:NB-ARC domain-containing protein n=1 Tax=Oryza glumipatula TaxID=40148 RepID=A0A0E0B180_9ORYZ
MERQTGSVLGTSLRREYPGLVKEYAGPRQRKRKRLAMSWGHYFGEKDHNGMTAGNRVKDEFWSFFTTQEEDMEELDKNIDNYCQARVPKIICQARVDAMKKYYGKGIKGKNASAIELNFEHAFVTGGHQISTRRSAKEVKMHVLLMKTMLNSREDLFHSELYNKTWCINLDQKMQVAWIPTEFKWLALKPHSKVYHEEHGEEHQPVSSELDGNVVYKAFGGLKHGWFAMGNGVFKKTEVLAAVKHKKSGISGSTNSYNAVVRENAQLRHEVTEQRGMIREQRGMIQEQRGMLKAVYEKLGMDIPEEVLSRLSIDVLIIHPFMDLFCGGNPVTKVDGPPPSGRHNLATLVGGAGAASAGKECNSNAASRGQYQNFHEIPPDDADFNNLTIYLKSASPAQINFKFWFFCSLQFMMASSLFSYFFGMKSRILSPALPQQSYLSSAELPSLTDHVNEEVAKLDRTVRRITAVLVDADEREIADETMKLWISELKQVTWEAEGILEDYSYELLRSTTVQEEKEGLCRKESRISRCTSSLLDPLEVYGREDEKKLIISSLLDGCLTFKKRRLKEHEYETCKAGAVRLISIVAMGGMGKTTLARLVYNDARVQNHFDIQAWVWVSEVFDKLTKAAIESVTAKPCDLTELEPLQRQLHKEVKGKKILLVFDDVWNEDTIKWETMKRPFSAVATGSHMIITTRNENVSTIVQAKKVIHLGGLQKDDSWALFCKLSFPDNACRETELGPIGRKIVEKSDGVPLVLKTLGAMLSLDTSLEFWNHVLTSDLWELGPGWDHILPILKLSYYSLPAILKRCFTFLAAFPRGHKFDLEELVHMWCALGFIQEDSAKRMEEIGHLYLAGSREKFVIVHDLIHDLAKSIGGKEILVKKCCGSSVGGCNTSANNHLRYLAVLAGTTPFYSDNKLVPFTLPVAGHFPLRSLSFQSKWRTYLRSCVRNNLRTFFQVRVQSQWWYNLEGCLLHSPHLKYLRILDVSSSDQIKLDKSVGVLHHLRYLGMCQREIPEAISKMYKLQTLRNTYPFDMIFLPRNVTALSNLRHLVLPRGFPVTIPSGIHRLTKLQSLSTFAVADVGSGAAMLDEIKDINTLQGELCIMDLQNITHDRIWEPRSANLSKKKLTRLELVWNPLPSYKSVPHDEVVLESLQPHNCIRQLVISGFRGLNFSSWLGDRSLFSLQELELCKCYYTDHLPPLGQLPNLKQLKLTSLWKLRSIGPEFYGDCEAPFQCLETMVVQNLVAWEEWWLPENHPHCVFPLLHTIDIRGSHKLVRLPLSNLHALAAITVSSCSKLETIVGLKERCEVTAGNSGLKAGQTNVLPSLRRVKVTACPSLEEPLISMLRRQTEIGFSYWEQSPSTSPTDIADFGKTTWKDCGKNNDIAKMVRVMQNHCNMKRCNDIMDMPTRRGLSELLEGESEMHCDRLVHRTELNGECKIHTLYCILKSLQVLGITQ